ncbi:MAG: TIGR04086 family membrane protein [Bacilli bacterium]
MKCLGKSCLYSLSFLLLSVLFITVLGYFNIIKYIEIYKFIIIIASLFIGGYIMGNSVSIKGWLSGLKYSLLFILFSVLITLFFSKFSLKCLMYYFILLVSGVFGGMIGITRKKED